MDKTKFLAILFAACSLLPSCTRETDSEALSDLDRQYCIPMVMQLSLSAFDVATKAQTVWKEGDAVYLLFSTDEGKVSGKAVYSAASAKWTVSYTGSLKRDAETPVSVWYFDGAGTATDESVSLLPTTGIYADNAGKYIFPTDGDLLVTGTLAPQTGRIRFKGAPDTEIKVRNLRQYTYLNLATGEMSSSVGIVSQTVQADGYTPYLYASFVDTTTRTLNIINGQYMYSANCPPKVLQTGYSGWMDIPTAESHNEWTKKKYEDPFNGHEYVDLELTSGTLWAACNVGATNPEEYGDYFAWGETIGYNSGKTNFDWSTYTWCKGSYDNMTKYCTNSSYGTVDNKTELELTDDAARANWGGQWRMPSSAQIDELISECNTEWTTQNSVYGRKVTSKKNGKSIFLPAAGYRNGSSLGSAGSNGDYWSRSLNESYSYSGSAYYLSFYSSGFYRDLNLRYDGQSVRPVVSE